MDKRHIINTADIQKITGLSYSWAIKRLNLIKSAYNRPKNGFITIKEYCEYEMFNEAEIREFLHIE